MLIVGIGHAQNRQPQAAAVQRHLRGIPVHEPEFVAPDTMASFVMETTAFDPAISSQSTVKAQPSPKTTLQPSTVS
jgi:hypothetical protein